MPNILIKHIIDCTPSFKAKNKKEVLVNLNELLNSIGTVRKL